MYYYTVSDYIQLSISAKLTIHHITSGNRTYATDFKHLAYFDITHHFFLNGRLQHTLHRLFDFVDGIVDNGVVANLDVFLLCQLTGLSRRSHLESEDNCIRSRRQQYIRLCNLAYTFVYDAYHDFFSREFLQ